MPGTMMTSSLTGLIVLTLGFLGAAISSLIAGGAFEKLVDLQFTNHHQAWVASGRPAGGRLSRREASIWRSGVSAAIAAWQWLFRTPQWAEGEPAALPLLRRMRRSYVWLIASVVVVLFGMFVLGRAV